MRVGDAELSVISVIYRLLLNVSGLALNELAGPQYHPHKRVGILILATPRYIGYKNCLSDAPMQQEGWVLPLPTYIMGVVHHEMGIRSSQLIVSRCRDSV